MTLLFKFPVLLADIFKVIMPNRHQLGGSILTPIINRNRSDEVDKETCDFNDIFGDSYHTELGSDLKNYEMYKADLHECEYMFGMINRLEIIEDIIQENNSSFKCPICLQAFPELNRLPLHHCNTDDLDLFKGGSRSSRAAMALTSTRKDIGDLLDFIPKANYAEYQNKSGVDK